MPFPVLSLISVLILVFRIVSGDGNKVSLLHPIISSPILTSQSMVSAGEHFSCAVSLIGELKCWGHNTDGELGNGRNDDDTTSPMANVMTSVVDVCTGRAFTCALKSTGNVFCFGVNADYDVSAFLWRSFPLPSFTSTCVCLNCSWGMAHKLRRISRAVLCCPACLRLLAAQALWLL